MVHMPVLHAVAATFPVHAVMQLLPQVPQLLGSLSVSTQLGPHGVWPAGHCVVDVVLIVLVVVEPPPPSVVVVTGVSATMLLTHVSAAASSAFASPVTAQPPFASAF